MNEVVNEMLHILEVPFVEEIPNGKTTAAYNRKGA